MCTKDRICYLDGKNAQKEQSSAEQTDHPLKVYTKACGIAVYLLQADKLSNKSETPPGGGQCRRFVQDMNSSRF